MRGLGPAAKGALGYADGARGPVAVTAGRPAGADTGASRLPSRHCPAYRRVQARCSLEKRRGTTSTTSTCTVAAWAFAQAAERIVLAGSLDEALT